MDIERHILDAVSTASETHSPRHLETSSTISQQRSPLTSHFTPSQHHGNSSAEDVSTTSDSGGDERDYQTDFTTPESSESCAEDMQPDDVEDFRDREYPQLKGKTYLDHGGTTVCALHDRLVCSGTWTLLTVVAALCQVLDRGLLSGSHCESLWQSSFSIDSLCHRWTSG